MGVTRPGSAVDISVVIPVRNGCEFLLRSVKSVERVALAPGHDLVIEIVVVDDGADRPIRPSLEAGHLRVAVSVVDGPGRGPSVARNVGAAAASGAHLAFLDVDDILLPSWAELARALARADAAAPPDAVRGPCLVEDLIGGGRGGMGPSWMPGSYAVNRSAFERVGGFDERVKWGEHHQLGGRMAKLDGARIVDLGGLGPVMVKLDDRSAAQRLGYAARRHEAAQLELQTATDPRDVAAALDTASVSLARMRDWSGARDAARRARHEVPDPRRRLRCWVLATPGVRNGWFRGRLAAGDAFRRARSALRTARRRTAWFRSVVVVGERARSEGERCPVVDEPGDESPYVDCR